MAEIGELYTAEILEHNRRPHNRGVLAAANRSADGDNPQCGDRLTVYLELCEGVIRDASFEGPGCAIAQASASLLTDGIKGRTVAGAEELIAKLEEMMGSAPVASAGPSGLGGLAALAGVRNYPARIECASLAWHTLAAALGLGPSPS